MLSVSWLFAWRLIGSVALSACASSAPAAPVPAPTTAAPDVAHAAPAPIAGLFALPAVADPQGDWSMLDAVVAEKSIVLLGESLHVTAEFPRVRLPIVRHLHERLGFDLIAFEGSMIDAWLAQDQLLSAPDDVDAVMNASAAGWLSLWNTPDMRAVLAYIHATRTSDKPLYFASMDIQPAMGGHPIKARVLQRFVARVFELAGESPKADLVDALLPLRSCSGPQPPPPERRRAVDALSAAIRKADARVRATSAMHADALALTIDMLQQRLTHCGEAFDADGKWDWKQYKNARDRHQASNVLALRDEVSRSHRVVVWGHHTHTAYQAAGANARVSISGVLRERAPGQTYALGLYAGAGEFLRIQDGPQESITLSDIAAPGDA
jgi:erythromycin esterase